MREPRRRVHRTAAAGMLIGLLAVFALASPAAAHAGLAGSTPKDGGTATKAVTEIALRFTEPVRQSRTTVAVKGPDGTSYSDGTPRAVDKNVTQAVSALPLGRITVDWSTVSADGHAIKGDFTFTNRVAPASPAAPTSPPVAISPTNGPSPSSVALDNVSADDTPEPGTPWGGIIAAVVGALIVAGGLLFWWRRRSHG